jgi:hypothetical protein
MIPKSGHRFSEQIMRKKKANNHTANRSSSDDIRQWMAGCITIGSGTKPRLASQ